MQVGCKELVKKITLAVIEGNENLVIITELMKQLWEVKRYECSGLSAQNLRDKTAHGEKRLGSVRETNDTDLSRVKCISSSSTTIKEGDKTNIKIENEQLRPQICISDDAQSIANMNEYHDLGDGSRSSPIRPNLPEIQVLPRETPEPSWGQKGQQKSKGNHIIN